MTTELEKSVENLDDVDESLRFLYEQSDEGFQLRDLTAFEDVVVPGLKSALQKERRSRKDAERKIVEAERRLEGVDFEELETLRTFYEEHKGKDAKDGDVKGAVESLKKQLKEQYEGKLTEKDTEIHALTNQLENALIDSTATLAISSEKGVPELLLPHIKSRAKMVKEDGQLHVRVFDNDGNQRVNKEGDYMSIGELVTEMKQSKVFARAFDGSNSSGGGTPPGGRNGGAGSGKKRSQMDTQTKSEFIAEHGVDEYLRLPY